MPARLTAFEIISQLIPAVLAIALAKVLLTVLCFTPAPLYSQTATPPSSQSASSAASQTVITVDVDSVIHPITVEILRHAIKQAETTGAAAVLIRLNTPGGMMDAMRECVEVIVASKTPVVTYVTPSGARAASAGFFLLEAGDIAAMAPGTNTGAASPVLMGEKMDPVMRKKVEEDASASLRSIVSRRGRNADLAEKTVLEAKAFTENEALKQNLIDLLADNDRALFEAIAQRRYKSWSGEERTLAVVNPVFVPYQESWREQLMSAVSDPNLAFILTIAGVLGVYVEFTHPGLILPGVAGAIAALLGLSALSILPINWMGVALLVLAAVFFVLEANFASHGILGAGGAVAMALGAVLLVDSPIPEMRIRWGVALAVSLAFTAITVFLLSLVLRAHRSKVRTGVESLPGREAVAVEDLAPSGRIFLDGDYWNAISSAPVAKGDRVRVLRLSGLTVYVEPVAEPSPPSSQP
ncbi:MAG: nodulation protein NfeD [Bryobacterales bacterium]|nr:nodulation protein NfeD [Bryobacterales bacterium]